MITVLTGVNNFLVRNELDKLVGAFVAEHGDLALERMDGEDVDFARVSAALSSMPFLSNKKMVILSGAANNKSITERIEDLLSSADDTTDLIIVEPKLDKRSVYYKTLKKQKDYFEFAEPDESALTSWLTQAAKTQGGEISASDARNLVAKVGPNQQMLAGELEKLILYEPKISKETVDLLVESSPKSTIFDMLEAAFNGGPEKALRLFAEQRQLRQDPAGMMALIAWQLHILAVIKFAGDRSPGQIASEAHINPYVVNKSINIAKRLTVAEIKRLIHTTLELDVALKSQSIDADEALQNLLILIAEIKITA